MADYFDLPHLKYHAGRALEQTLNSSNSISTYRLAKTYHCEELARHTEEYVDLNFTNVAKTEEFLGLPYQDVKNGYQVTNLSMPKKMCLKSFCDGLVIKTVNETNIVLTCFEKFVLITYRVTFCLVMS